MSRATIAWDRVATLIIATLLIALGLLGLLWWRGAWSAIPETLDLGPASRVLSQPWWPWAAGLAAVVLALIGLRWLFAHLPQRSVGTLNLPGSNSQGRLRTDASRVADAAAEALEHTNGIHSASGTVRRDRGQLVARLRATIDPDADLKLIAQAADRASAELANVLGRDDLHCHVQLNVASTNRTQTRVR